ncbi:MAG: hypothetical protein ACRDMW_00995, partial [Gaiellaceae bacterium]
LRGGLLRRGLLHHRRIRRRRERRGRFLSHRRGRLRRRRLRRSLLVGRSAFGQGVNRGSGIARRSRPILGACFSCEREAQERGGRDDA